MSPVTDPRVPTGIEGLDTLLGGGLPRHHVYLIEGDSGTGKTTLALQFALEGVRRREPVLYITLSETLEELQAVAASHGWSLEGVELCELPPEQTATPLRHYTLFHPTEVELDRSLQYLLAEVERVQPARLVLDSVSGIRLLTDDPLRHRQQIQSLRRLLTRRACTTLLLEEITGVSREYEVTTLVHGTLRLERFLPDYGVARRRLCITKLRGVKYPDSYHDFRITTGNFLIFPRLIAADHEQALPQERVGSGVPELDALLGGGLERGYSVLLTGPAGIGKSTLAAQYAIAAAERGETSALYIFDETRRAFVNRATSLGMKMPEALASGHIRIVRIDPGALSPGEFAAEICRQVEEGGARLVIIDSLSGYLHAMPEERLSPLYLQELLTYLNHCGVITLVTAAQPGVIGTDARPPLVEVSTLVDTMILLRFFEFHGQVRKAISVIKQRSGWHEPTIRELRLEPAVGLRVGEPLETFQGVLTGNPQYTGEPGPLLKDPP